MRLINDPLLDGPANMARDEALLLRVGAGDSPPTLRLYQWDPPTISLGYFQPYAEYAALAPPLKTLAVVRRLTGGGAILHDLELTYSLILPQRHDLLRRGPNCLYELVHNALITCLRALGVTAAPAGRTDDSTPIRGPLFCFARRHRYDLVTAGGKIVGSAQRRTREALLQHGSIILGDRLNQPGVARPEVPYVAAIRGLRTLLPEHLGHRGGTNVEAGEWSPAELTRAAELTPGYAGDKWTRRT